MKYKTEKHDQESFIKLPKNDNEYHRKKNKSLNKNKVLLFMTEFSIGDAFTKTNSTLSIVNPSVGVIISSSTLLLTSIAIPITNEDFSKLKIRYTKVRNWLNANTFLYEKTSESSMVD